MASVQDEVNMTNQLILQTILEDLKRQNQMPRRIDFSIVGGRFWCVVADKDLDQLSVINEDVFTGFSDSKEVALLKALSERAERYSFIEGYQQRYNSCLTERSDGFAAIPKIMDSYSARDNAFNEAVERFVWSTWWDDKTIAFDRKRLTASAPEVKTSEYIQFVFSELGLEYLDIITPWQNLKTHEVQILIGKIRNKGFISGGACGFIQDNDHTFLRGLDELYRHGFAFERSTAKNIVPESLYENRLNYFAAGLGNHLVESRLDIVGTNSVTLPDLEIDTSVDSGFSSYHIYRCYFKDQPPFVGGAMERLCL